MCIRDRVYIMEEKKYIRNFTEEARAKQKEHLSQIRQKAMEEKRNERDYIESEAYEIRTKNRTS